MKTNGESKVSLLLIGLGLTAIGGLVAALLARKETRDFLRERSTKSLDYLNEQGKKLRESTEEIVEKGKEFISHRGGSGDAARETEKQSYQEDRGKTLGA